MDLQQQDIFQYVAPDRVSKKRPAGRFVLPEKCAKRRISGVTPPGIVKKATESCGCFSRLTIVMPL